MLTCALPHTNVKFASELTSGWLAGWLPGWLAGWWSGRPAGCMAVPSMDGAAHGPRAGRGVKGNY